MKVHVAANLDDVVQRANVFLLCEQKLLNRKGNFPEKMRIIIDESKETGKKHCYVLHQLNDVLFCFY